MAIKIGELLLKANVITEAQLKAALDEQRRWGGKVGEILVRMTFITEDLMVKALSKQLGVPRLDLDNARPTPKPVVSRVPYELARDLHAVPIRLQGDKTLVVAMAEPTNLEQLDTLQKVARCRISPVIATSSQIARHIAQSYEDGSASLDDDDGSTFKVVDAQGKTVVKSVAELEARGAAAAAAPRTAPAPAPAPASAPAPAPANGAQSPAVLLAQIEAAQRREVTALKAMIELLIEKGIFSRDEYLARVRR